MYYNINDNIGVEVFQGEFMSKDAFSIFEKRAKKIMGKTLVFPEGVDLRVAGAVKRLVKNGFCKAVVLGNPEELKRVYRGYDVAILDPKMQTEASQKYAKILYELRKHKGLTEKQACSIISDANYFGCTMIKAGDADGMVSGAVAKTADVLRPAFQIIKQKAGNSLASSCFILEVPQNKKDVLGENGMMVLADCAVVPYPDADGLSSIAKSSIETAINICGIEPRVSFLSYSSNSAGVEDETIQKIRMAVKKTREVYPNVIIEGELQADASLNPKTAQKKVPDSRLGGRANVLVFPDLNAGNIGYKLIQQFAGVRAIGPIIQGLNSPVNDLSRGATEDEIYLTSLITLIQTES